MVEVHIQTFTFLSEDHGRLSIVLVLRLYLWCEGGVCVYVYVYVCRVLCVCVESVCGACAESVCGMCGALCAWCVLRCVCLWCAVCGVWRGLARGKTPSVGSQRFRV